ncbi:hypothetical protein E4T50_13448 [Aureobasidium sp. EXF-12298]|nr:hypothetical protein E4T50_13448 [Aureobasidium sp. EXF-12298]KAI4770715.1 hypothetical protein E4T52_14277 [Aureobasidium sp. EXF-3400]
MPSTKSQKVAKAANTEDDTRRFFERQRGMNKAIKNRRDEARSRIRQNHSNRQKDLQARIKALKRSSSVKQPGSNADVPTFDHTAFEALRDLLAYKADIERRIAQSIDTLEKAMNTASHEFEVVLRSQAEIFRTATTPANTSAAAASSKALIVKQ